MKKAEQLKKDQRRQARMARRAEEEARRRQGQRRRQLYVVGGAAALAVVIGLWVWSATRPKLGEAIPTLLNVPHIPSITSPHEPYNSNPPTSGQHVAAPAPWGFYTEVIADEVLVHNLEHGGIWISYKDPKDTATIDQLRALMPQLPRKTIVTLRPKNDSRIAVAAWGRLMELDHVDAGKIVEFANEFRNTSPEPLAP
ncbi:MAG TPA: DUF3105 domain-containing protein [bacterium]